MYQVEPNPTFKATVLLEKPGGGGQFVRIEFRHVTGDPLKDLISTKGGDNAVLMHDLIVGWDTEDGPNGAWHGMPMPYSLDALKDIQQKQPRHLRNMFKAYTYEVGGVVLGN